MAALKVLVAYDVADDRRRLALSDALGAVGERVQQSVFVCTFERNDLPRVVADLEDLIDEGADALLVVPICGRCEAELLVFGDSPPLDLERFWWA